MRASRFIGRLGAALPLLLSMPLQAQEEETPYPVAAEEEGYAYGYQDQALIEVALEETLSQPEFARLRVEPEPEKEEERGETAAFLDRFFEWLARALWGDDAREEPASGPAFSLPGARLLVYAMAFVILAAAVFFVARSVLAISRDRRSTEVEAAARVFGPETAPGELHPEEYWRRALAHGENRRFKEGTRELLLGAMSALERRGLVRFRRGLTNRDYFYAVRGPARESFGSIASAFERIYFGRREATGDAFRESCRAYQKSFREAST